MRTKGGGHLRTHIHPTVTPTLSQITPGMTFVKPSTGYQCKMENIFHNHKMKGNSYFLFSLKLTISYASRYIVAKITYLCMYIYNA